jgi:hypothetical protein
MRLNFTVREVCQAAGGGSYVCIFDAEVKVNSTGSVYVLVDSVDPPETGSEYIDSASNAICAGAAHVLGPMGKGAEIRVARLVVNNIDFKPSRFTLYTAREIQRVIAANAFDSADGAA